MDNVFIEILDEFISKLPRTLSRDDKLRFSVMASLGRLFSLVKDIDILLRNESYDSILILHRSLIHLLIDLKNIEADPSYIDSVAKKFADSKCNELKKIASTRKLNNLEKKVLESYLIILDDPQIIDAKILNEETKMKIFEDQNYFYKVIYSQLSNDSHSNMGLMLDKYFDVKSKNFTFTYDVNTTGYTPNQLIVLTNCLLLECIVSAGNILEIDITAEIQLLKKIEKELQGV